MTIVRAARPNSCFTILRNEVLQDERLSYRARGILVSVLSRPDSWRCSAWDLARDGSEGRGAVLTALRELETHGYLRRSKWQDEAGRWHTDSIIYDKPVDNLGESEGITQPNPVDNNATGVRLPDSGSPAFGNRTLYKELDKELDKTPKPPNGKSTTTFVPHKTCPEHKMMMPCISCAADRKAKKD